MSSTADGSTSDAEATGGDSDSTGCETGGCGTTTTDDPLCVTPGEDACLVPSEQFETVQEALDYPYCPEVVIEPGTYAENLIVDRDVTIAGRCPGAVTVDGGGVGATVMVAGGLLEDGHDITLRNLVITGGFGDRGGGVSNDNDGTLALVHTTVRGNTARLGAGVFHQYGTLTVEGSELSENAAELGDAGDPDAVGVAAGGGLYAIVGTVDIYGASVIAHNTVSSALDDPTLMGAGLYAQGSQVMIREGTWIVSNKIELLTVGSGAAYGGGIACEQSPALTLEDVRLAENTITGRSELGALDLRGGGLWVERTTVALMGTTVAQNSVAIEDVGEGERSARGGGLFTEGGTITSATVTVAESTFESNTARATNGAVEGGGLYAHCDEDGEGLTVILIRDTFEDNVAESETNAAGGAIFAAALGDMSGLKLNVRNSTLSGNQATGVNFGESVGEGGGLLAHTLGVSSEAVVELSNVTIANNSATSFGGGLRGQGGGVAMTMRNSLLAGNDATSGPECSGSLYTGGYNVVGSAAGCVAMFAATDQLDVDAALGPIADNGGPTRTHALLMGSPAIDAGAPTNCLDESNAPLETDQRAEPRKAGIRCDAGAYELQP